MYNKIVVYPIINILMTIGGGGYYIVYRNTFVHVYMYTYICAYIIKQTKSVK